MFSSMLFDFYFLFNNCQKYVSNIDFVKHLILQKGIFLKKKIKRFIKFSKYEKSFIILKADDIGPGGLLISLCYLRRI